MENFISQVNALVWNPVLVVLLLGAGLFFSVRTRFVQVRKFSTMLRSLFSKKKDGNGITSFQAFCLALSGRVGTGNIVGVATAIAFGGPGAVFWMWVVAFLGASTAFVESTLAQIYKFRHTSGYRGGPFAIIDKGLGIKWLGVVFAIIAVVSCGLFLTTVQANGTSSAVANSFPVIMPLYSGIALAVLLGLVVIGGVKRIAVVASVLTPFMALGYIVMLLVVVAMHIHEVPAVFSAIFKGAFGLSPICSGILGSTIAMGVKRGIFSNEAGQGTGAIVSAATDVEHPAQQGLAQSFSVYVDTLLVCTATALMILTSGTYNILDGQGGMLYAGAPELGNNYVAYTQSAVDSVFHGFGSRFVAVAMIFFAFTTLLAYYFYAESSIIYLFQGKNGRREKWVIRVLQILMLAAVVFGAVHEADFIWQLGDIGVGVMAWITVVSILILCPKAIRSLKEFESKK